jgi:hypothetical protein
MIVAMAVRRSPRLASISSLKSGITTEITTTTTGSNDRPIPKKRETSNQIAQTKPEKKTKLSSSAESATSLSRVNEVKLRKNFEFVIGIDEAGRGLLTDQSMQ